MIEILKSLDTSLLPGSQVRCIAKAKIPLLILQRGSCPPLLSSSRVMLAQALIIISLVDTAAASWLVSSPHPIHSPHHSLGCQLKPELKPGHATA